MSRVAISELTALELMDICRGLQIQIDRAVALGWHRHDHSSHYQYKRLAALEWRCHRATQVALDPGEPA